MSVRVAIFISGGGSNMLKLVESMTGDHPARPCLVLSNDPEAGGLARAAALGIATAVVRHEPFKGDRRAFEAALGEALAPHAPDVICLAGFMRKLTGDFVDPWKGRMLNIHPSLLPAFPGLNTHQRAIDAGCRFAGARVHQVTPELDHGAILAQAVVPVLPNDTAESLAARVLTQEHLIYPQVVAEFLAQSPMRSNRG